MSDTQESPPTMPTTTPRLVVELEVQPAIRQETVEQDGRDPLEIAAELLTKVNAETEHVTYRVRSVYEEEARNGE